MAMAGRFRSNISFFVRNLVRSDSVAASASVSAVKTISTFLLLLMMIKLAVGLFLAVLFGSGSIFVCVAESEASEELFE